jgi:hypothetical protein
VAAYNRSAMNNSLSDAVIIEFSKHNESLSKFSFQWVLEKEQKEVK